MFSDLDPILHSQLRLAIVSLLIAEEKADFAYTLKASGGTRATDNYIIQIGNTDTET